MDNEYFQYLIANQSKWAEMYKQQQELDKQKYIIWKRKYNNEVYKHMRPRVSKKELKAIKKKKILDSFN